MGRLAATISIGDELLAGETLDSNARLLARRLGNVGWRVVRHRVVGDDQSEIAAQIRDAASAVELVLITGGLGPTADDVTREALAEVLDESLVPDGEAEQVLRAFFAGRGYRMPESNLRQIMRPTSARMLANHRGTAPGIAARVGDAMVFLLPGPPHELTPMFDDSVATELSAVPGARTRVVRAFGMGESAAAERIASLMSRESEPLVGTTVSGSVLSARIRARLDETTDRQLDAIGEQVRDAWAPYVFGKDEDTLECALGRLLDDRSLTLASAESCSGGLVGWMVTRIAGSSGWYRGGWITYENQRKHEDLGVPLDTLDRQGAVSRATAEAMACGARERAGADLGVSTTGIAGPGGGNDEKPVGTVWIAVADAEGVSARRFVFPGDRSAVRDRTAKAALQLVRFRVLGLDAPLLWEEPS